jgi:hypothetical protein
MKRPSDRLPSERMSELSQGYSLTEDEKDFLTRIYRKQGWKPTKLIEEKLMVMDVDEDGIEAKDKNGRTISLSWYSKLFRMLPEAGKAYEMTTRTYTIIVNPSFSDAMASRRELLEFEEVPLSGWDLVDPQVESSNDGTTWNMAVEIRVADPQVAKRGGYIYWTECPGTRRKERLPDWIDKSEVEVRVNNYVLTATAPESESAKRLRNSKGYQKKMRELHRRLMREAKGLPPIKARVKK